MKIDLSRLTSNCCTNINLLRKLYMYVSLLLLNFGIELFSDYMVIKGIIRQQVMCEASHEAGT